MEKQKEVQWNLRKKRNDENNVGKSVSGPLKKVKFAEPILPPPPAEKMPAKILKRRNTVSTPTAQAEIGQEVCENTSNIVEKDISAEKTEKTLDWDTEMKKLIHTNENLTSIVDFLVKENGALTRKLVSAKDTIIEMQDKKMVDDAKAKEQIDLITFDEGMDQKND